MKYLLIFAIVFGAFSQPIGIFAHTKTQIVEITSGGFVPKEVVVDTSGTVIFVNNDKYPHWPASDVHPTHELYPEFDPRQEIEPGKSWVFKPKKIGDWKFHNHLDPHQKGVISVVKEQDEEINDAPLHINIFEKIRQALLKVFNNFNNFLSSSKKTDNYQLKSATSFKTLPIKDQFTELKAISKDRGGTKKAWEYVKAVFKGDPGSSGNIHDLAHLAGGLIYDQSGFNGLSSCSADFAFGCYHGFLDKAFEKNLERLSDAELACLRLGPKDSGPVASCIHGIGHGIASYFSVSDVKKSLSACRKLNSGQQFCFDGVFMEYVRNASDSFFNKDNPVSLCAELEKSYGYAYSFACGRNIPPLLMGRYKKSLDEVVSACLSYDSKEFTNGCVDSLGLTLASSNNTDQIISGCQKIADPNLSLRCSKAAAGELIFQEDPNWKTKSFAICDKLTDGNIECREYLQRIIKEYDRG